MASDETTMKTIHLMYNEDEDGDYSGDAAGLSRMSRLSIKTSDDADTEMSDDDDEGNNTPTKNNSDADGRPWAELRGHGRREMWLERAWQMKRSSSTSDQCRVLVRPRGPDSGPICMDMDEVKACRELGLELPCDWTVEIPCGFTGFDTSSGGDSPIGRISSPGDDPRDVKARLKVWAQAVVLASSSSLIS